MSSPSETATHQTGSGRRPLMFTKKAKPRSMNSRVIVQVLFTLVVLGIQTASGQTPYTQDLRSFYTRDYGISRAAAVSFSPDAGALLIAETSIPNRPNVVEFVIADLWGDYLGRVEVPFSPTGLFSTAFSRRANSLFILDQAANRVLKVPARSNGRPLESLQPLSVLTGLNFNIRQPQGITFDDRNGDLYVLDGVGPYIVRIPPGTEDNPSGGAGRLGPIALPDATQARGIAFNSSAGRLYVLDSRNDLHELDEAGGVLSTRHLDSVGVKDPIALVFAQSPDLTDDPSVMYLYVLEASPGQGGSQQRPSRIAELSLNAPTLSASLLAAPTVLPRLVNTINAWSWNPPSPDTAGIAYITPNCPQLGSPAGGTYLTSDSEVEESNFVANGIWQGVNLFLMNPAGTLLQTYTTYPQFSKEPTGVAFNSANCHIFFSDDSGSRYVWEVDVGADGILNTADDVITRIVTANYGDNDPEGVAFDSARGILFINDGVNSEVYKVTTGPDGKFGTADDQVTHFDTSVLGISDPEGLEYNPDTNTLYIAGPSSNKKIVELTTTGEAVRVLDITFANVVAPAGLAYGPGTWANGNGKSLYLTVRGVDNGSNPNENDGRVYEFDVGVPAITSFTPTSGSSGTVVTISGENLGGVTGVSFNGVAASFTVNSGTQITANVPSGATSGPISASNSVGIGSSSGNFTIGSATVHDVAVTALVVPSPVEVNQAQTVSVTAANQGTVSETFTVTLGDN
ncbi:MAG TPA: hypothetical protein VLE03_08995, partial [Nitrospiraceae bacterium]|nr:hypothetical protein [Nitrospiraceae bacterium]